MVPDCFSFYIFNIPGIRNIEIKTIEIRKLPCFLTLPPPHPSPHRQSVHIREVTRTHTQASAELEATPSAPPGARSSILHA